MWDNKTDQQQKVCLRQILRFGEILNVQTAPELSINKTFNPQFPQKLSTHAQFGTRDNSLLSLDFKISTHKSG
jgi:hypothetical protein